MSWDGSNNVTACAITICNNNNNKFKIIFQFSFFFQPNNFHFIIFIYLSFLSLLSVPLFCFLCLKLLMLGCLRHLTFKNKLLQMFFFFYGEESSDKTNVQIIAIKHLNKTKFQNLSNWSWNHQSDSWNFSATKIWLQITLLFDLFFPLSNI